MPGYEVSFEDFRKLIVDFGDRAALTSLLGDWFSARVSLADSHATIRLDDEALVDLEAIHRAIQEDPDRQRALHNVAMTFWHFG